MTLQKNNTNLVKTAIKHFLKRRIQIINLLQIILTILKIVRLVLNNLNGMNWVNSKKVPDDKKLFLRLKLKLGQKPSFREYFCATNLALKFLGKFMKINLSRQVCSLKTLKLQKQFCSKAQAQPCVGCLMSVFCMTFLLAWFIRFLHA